MSPHTSIAPYHGPIALPTVSREPQFIITENGKLQLITANKKKGGKFHANIHWPRRRQRH